jgi:hypothetical protein
LVRSPWRYCPFRLPVGPPLPLAPPCNRQHCLQGPEPAPPPDATRCSMWS